MGKVIGFCNQKGGTGKTTSVVNIASFFALAGKKTLLIDMDPQGNASSGLGVDKDSLEHTIYDVLTQAVLPEKAMLHTNVRYLYVIPANTSLAGIEIELVQQAEREFYLKKTIAKIKDNFEFILVDAPPSLSLLTLNVLAGSDSVVVPIQCEYYALEGLSRLFQTLELIKERLNSSLEVEGILLTMADYRTRLTLQVIDEVRRFFKDKVYKTVIPRNVKLSEAPSFGKPIYFYDPACSGAKAYFKLCCEMLNQELKGVYDDEEAGTRQRFGSIDTQAGDAPGPGAGVKTAAERIHLY